MACLRKNDRFAPKAVIPERSIIDPMGKLAM